MIPDVTRGQNVHWICWSMTHDEHPLSRQVGTNLGETCRSSCWHLSFFCLISRFPHSHCYQEPQTIIFNGCLDGETSISHVKICNHPIETTIKNWLFRVPGKSCLFCGCFVGMFISWCFFQQDGITVNQAITSQTQVQTLEVSQDWPVKIADVLPASLEIASWELSLSKKPFHRNINLYQASDLSVAVRGQSHQQISTVDFCQVDCTVSKTICEKANIKASGFSLVKFCPKRIFVGTGWCATHVEWPWRCRFSYLPSYLPQGCCQLYGCLMLWGLVLWIPGILPVWKGLKFKFFGGVAPDVRIPNHRAPKHQLTISWCWKRCGQSHGFHVKVSSQLTPSGRRHSRRWLLYPRAS